MDDNDVSGRVGRFVVRRVFLPARAAESFTVIGPDLRPVERPAGLGLRTEAASLLPAPRRRDPEPVRLLDLCGDPLLHLRPADLCDLRRRLAVQQRLLGVGLQLRDARAAENFAAAG